MKTQIWLYSFHHVSLAAAILFCLNTPHRCVLCPVFGVFHTFQCETLIGMQAHLHTRSTRLLCCLAFVFLPCRSASLPPFCFTIVDAAADIHWNASMEAQMTGNPHLHCMLLHANVCAKLYLNTVLYCLHPQGSRERKIPKVGCVPASSILANETIGALIEAFTAQIEKKEEEEEAQ